jgi:hypothetical protein
MHLALLSLAGQALFLSLLYTSYSLGRRLLHTRSAALRLCATYVTFCWIATILFHVLISLESFRLLPALLAASGLALCAWFSGVDSAPALGRDLARVGAAVRRSSWPLERLGLVLLAAVASIALLRVLFLPLLGWDSLTYHGLKAAWWVQTGREIAYDAPGGWEYYRYFFGGGELLTAWAMLPFHSDLLAGIPDWAHWAALGLAAYSLTRQLAVPRTSAVLFVAVLSTAPVVISYVGSGYVDTQQSACLLIGISFASQWSARRGSVGSLVLAGGSLGLAVAAKSSAALHASILLVFVLAASWARRRGSLRAVWRDAAVFTTVLVLPSLRWLVDNYLSYGYPFGAVPVSIGPVRLGLAAPSLSVLLSLPTPEAYTLRGEIENLWVALRSFGGFSIFPAAAVFAIGRDLRRDPWLTLFLLCSIAATLVVYFAPAFSVIRINWSAGNGRFLVAAVVPMAILGLPLFCAGRWRRGAIEMLSCAAIAAHAYVYFTGFLGVAPTEEKLALAAGVVAMLLLIAAARLLAGRGRARFLASSVTAVVLATALATVGLRAMRNWLRQPAFRSSQIVHEFPRYWVEGLAALERAPGEKTVAVTAGPGFIGHDWFVYPFMGADLENRILYVSPLKGGDAAGDTAARHGSDPDYATWLGRLRTEGVTHVMSFRPVGPEIRWMEDAARGDDFVRLAGSPLKWGLFRLRPNRESDGSASDRPAAGADNGKGPG